MTEIRSERPDDFAAIRDLIVRLFHSTYGTGEAEAVLVDQLRRLPSYDPALSLVAIDDGQVIGHVMFSRVEVVTPGGARLPALALAPLGVHEDYRRHGVGAKLVRMGMQRGREAGYGAVFVQGAHNYYGRFGFIASWPRGLVTPFAHPESPDNMVACLDEAPFAAMKGDVEYPPPWDAWKKPSKQKLAEMLGADPFPRSSAYDPQWVIDNQMGPNALWLTEWLTQAMDLRPGMRVLDLGCGRALSSVFLAKEFGVQVWATDLWIPATENAKRISEAGISERVFPIHANARELPYAEGFFDAITCIDAYIYFGTDDLYLDYLVKFVRPGGQIGIVVPGFMQELDGPLPEHLKPFWAQECWSWHTADWWRNLWQRTGLVRVEDAHSMADGWRLYLQWKRALSDAGANRWPHDIAVLEADAGRYIGFIRMMGRRQA